MGLEGCRLCPLAYDENSGKMVLDSLCPYRYEFKVEKDDTQKLKSLLEGLGIHLSHLKIVEIEKE